MPRPLKAFTTTAGFFDLAVATPSMKAALEAWGADANLFHQGFARESHAVDVVTATMAKPGVVLRRPVGTNDPYTEHAEVSDAFVGQVKPPRRKETDRRAAVAYERQAAKREQARLKEEAERREETARRERAVAEAEAALRAAEDAHECTVAEFTKAQAALDRKMSAEERRWERDREKLKDAVREARSSRHLRVVS